MPETQSNIIGKRVNEFVKDYVVFDLETTGLSPEQSSIIEVAAIKIRDGKKVDEFVSLVNPHIPIPEQASRVNHITDQMVKDAPDLEEVLRHFSSFIKGEILVGHNIHRFDLPFLGHAIARLFKGTLRNDYVDTVFFAKEKLKGLSSYKLTSIADYYQISTNGAHRALGDCEMNYLCFEAIGRSKEGIVDQEYQLLCPKCNRKMVKRNGKFGTFFGCSGFPDCRHTIKAK